MRICCQNKTNYKKHKSSIVDIELHNTQLLHHILLFSCLTLLLFLIRVVPAGNSLCTTKSRLDQSRFWFFLIDRKLGDRILFCLLIHYISWSFIKDLLYFSLLRIIKNCFFMNWWLKEISDMKVKQIESVTSICICLRPIPILQSISPGALVFSRGGGGLADPVPPLEPLGPLTTVQPSAPWLHTQPMALTILPVTLVETATETLRYY